MPNDNCLDGMRCPQCRSEGPFLIQCRAQFEVHDDGSDTFSGLHWGDDDPAICSECAWVGTVQALRGGIDPRALLTQMWTILHREDDGKINPDKEWDADTIAALADQVYLFKQRPVLAETPGSTAQSSGHRH